MMPMPPCCASAMARCDSVTVSMAELTTGMFRPILRVSQVRVSVWTGTTSLHAGSKRISSNVRPSGIVSGIMRVNFDDTPLQASIRRWRSLRAIHHEDFHPLFLALQLEPEPVLQESLPQREHVRPGLRLQVRADVVSPREPGFIHHVRRRPFRDTRPRRVVARVRDGQLNGNQIGKLGHTHSILRDVNPWSPLGRNQLVRLQLSGLAMEREMEAIRQQSSKHQAELILGCRPRRFRVNIVLAGVEPVGSSNHLMRLRLICRGDEVLQRYVFAAEPRRTENNRALRVFPRLLTADFDRSNVERLPQGRAAANKA